ncbi:MAG: 50S ribosome-binding GTPase [Promethearchaeota archaeon]|nr:MAG: 50S ribosome-binding GTPase [Candidatus Lokiarchaeota archaeon]
MSEKPSLLIIGNSNVGKSSITRLLMPNPRYYKGKSGKKPGSTLLIRPISHSNMDYQIVDLPGFGYMKHSSHRRQEHLKKQIVIHIEKHYQDYFFGLVVINILRIEDEIEKYFIQNKKTIPLSFELIGFLKEFKINLLILINKIDKVSIFDKNRFIKLFLDSANEYNLKLVKYADFDASRELEIPYLEFSALKRINLKKLKQIIQEYLNQV